MGFFKSFFGGPDKSAQKAQLKQNELNQQIIKRQGELARTELNRLFPQAVEAERQGTQQALSLLSGTGDQPGTIEESLRTLQQGNLQAQNTLGGQESDFIAAILGGQIGRAPQPQAIDFGQSFANAELGPSSFLTPPAPPPSPQRQNTGNFSFGNLARGALGGRNSFNQRFFNIP